MENKQVKIIKSNKIVKNNGQKSLKLNYFVTNCAQNYKQEQLKVKQQQKSLLGICSREENMYYRSIHRKKFLQNRVRQGQYKNNHIKRIDIEYFSEMYKKCLFNNVDWNKQLANMA